MSFGSASQRAATHANATDLRETYRAQDGLRVREILKHVICPSRAQFAHPIFDLAHERLDTNDLVGQNGFTLACG